MLAEKYSCYFKSGWVHDTVIRKSVNRRPDYDLLFIVKSVKRS